MASPSVKVEVYLERSLLVPGLEDFLAFLSFLSFLSFLLFLSFAPYFERKSTFVLSVFVLSAFVLPGMVVRWESS